VSWMYARLSNEDLQQIQELEHELGVILIAYRDEVGDDSLEMDNGSLLNSWKERINWEATKRDRP